MKRALILLSGLALSLASHAKVLQQQLPQIHYVNLPVHVDETTKYDIGAQLRLPRNREGLIPAVVVLHASGGVDSTGNFYIKKLNKAGIATLELDMWGGRGMAGGADNRPDWPQQTLPDAYTALAYLAQHPDIDASKIGIMGFSWGGVVSMLTATNQYDAMSPLPFKFAAHVAHYPVCYGYNQIPGFEFQDLTGARVLIQSAELDQYDYPGACPNMVSQIPAMDRQYVEVIEYPGVHHMWDRMEPDLTVNDIFAHMGQGGEVLLAADPETAKNPRRKAVRFFKDVFGM